MTALPWADRSFRPELVILNAVQQMIVMRLVGLHVPYLMDGRKIIVNHRNQFVPERLDSMAVPAFASFHVMVSRIRLLVLPIIDAFIIMQTMNTIAIWILRPEAVAAGIVKSMAAAASFVPANASAVQGADYMSFALLAFNFE